MKRRVDWKWGGPGDWKCAGPEVDLKWGGPGMGPFPWNRRHGRMEMRVAHFLNQVGRRWRVSQVRGESGLVWL